MYPETTRGSTSGETRQNIVLIPPLSPPCPHPCHTCCRSKSCSRRHQRAASPGQVTRTDNDLEVMNTEIDWHPKPLKDGITRWGELSRTIYLEHAHSSRRLPHLLDLSHPVPNVVEGFLIRHVVDKEDPLCTSEVRRGDSAETLLSSCIPDLELDSLGITDYIADGTRVTC